jgi:hypothetical protein
MNCASSEVAGTIERFRTGGQGCERFGKMSPQMNRREPPYGGNAERMKMKIKSLKNQQKPASMNQLVCAIQFFWISFSSNPNTSLNMVLDAYIGAFAYLAVFPNTWAMAGW